MNVYITHPKEYFIPNSTIIYDDKTAIQGTNQITYLIYLDGKKTLPYFRKIICKEGTIIIFVSNFEDFYFQFKEFKYFLKYLNDNQYENYCNGIINNSITANISDNKISSTINEDNSIYFLRDCINEKQIIKYIKMENKLRKKYKLAIPSNYTRAISLSFFPDILNSIKTSLINPTLYYSKDTFSTKIIKEFMKGENKITLDTLRKNVLKGGNSEEFENELKSLLFCNILKLKDGYFYFTL